MKNVKFTTKDLKALGFKPVKEYDFIFVNSEGKVYDITKQRFLTPTKLRNHVRIENKNVVVPKLILSVFKGERIKRGQIIYKDGNKTNLATGNLQYKRLFEQRRKPKIKNRDLITVFRCYYPIEKGFKLADNLKKQMYLRPILEKRRFFETYQHEKNIEVFKTYVSGSIHSNAAKTAERHKIGVRDCSMIITYFIQLLVKDVFFDVTQGKLTVMDFEQ